MRPPDIVSYSTYRALMETAQLVHVPEQPEGGCVHLDNLAHKRRIGQDAEHCDSLIRDIGICAHKEVKGVGLRGKNGELRVLQFCHRVSAQRWERTTLKRKRRDDNSPGCCCAYTKLQKREMGTGNRNEKIGDDGNGRRDLHHL